MKNDYRLSGIYSAQWIPPDSVGRRQRADLTTQFDFEKSGGVDRVPSLGSAGEFSHFSPDERKAEPATVAELAAPFSVIANLTERRPKVAIEFGRFAKSLGLMAPPFIPLSQDDILAFLLPVAEAAHLIAAEDGFFSGLRNLRAN